MYIESAGFRVTPLLGGDGICYAQFIDPNTGSYITNTSVSCTAFWTDF